MKQYYISDQAIMDNWNYLLEHKEYSFLYVIKYRRTEFAFCQNLCFNDRHVGCLYIFGLKKYPDDLIHGYLGRFYINPKHRTNGNAIFMMLNIIKHFGSCVLHIASASPNRITGLNDDNREEYRNMLYKFYSHFGFERTSLIHTGMIKK